MFASRFDLLGLLEKIVSDTSAFKVIIEDDEGHREAVPVELGAVSIGRLESNTIRLNERNVSRQHARLVAESGVVFVEDLDSYNGLWVNGDRIKGRHEIRSGDLVRVGDFHLELRGEGLAQRSEETTQRTMVPEAEVTKTEIRMPAEPQPSASGMGQSVSIVRAEQPPPSPQRVVQEPEVHEATSIIRMDAPELRAPRSRAASIAGGKAKLVCVSTKFAGRDFEIGKTEVIIGRTSENDIAIDHRSVSRHHAKITFTNRRYLLVDLQSANGTLVNGEAYAQTELKQGDLIELGHVKLRFVPPGGSYKLTSEEQASVAASSRGRGDDEDEELGSTRRERGLVAASLRSLPWPLLAIGGLSLVAVIAVVIVLLVRPRPYAELAGSQNEVNVISGEIDTMLGRGHGLLAQRKWEQAANMATQVLKLDTQNVSAREILVKAQSERQAQAKYEETQRAVELGDWASAWRALQGLPVTSVYAEQSRVLAERVKGAFINELLAKARASIDEQDAESALARAAEISKIDSSRGEAAEIRAEVERLRAKDRRVASPTPTRAPPRPSPPPSRPAPPPSRPAPPAKVDVQALYREAVAQVKAGDNEQAIDLFNQCVQADPEFGGCYRGLGIAYARAGNQTRAAKHYKQYLKVSPNADDVEQVRLLLEQYETAP